MATQVQLRRGNTSQTSTFTGAVAEITIDTDKETVVVHDGSTAGGFALARESAVTANAASITAAFATANAAFATANSAGGAASAGSYANSAFTTANSSGSYANSAFAAANSASGAASAGSYANSAFLTANTPSYTANSAASYANGAFATANAAFARANSGARATASNTAPTGNTVGDLWLSLTDETLYIYSYDGVGNNWVDISGPILRTNEIQIQYAITANVS